MRPGWWESGCSEHGLLQSAHQGKLAPLTTPKSMDSIVSVVIIPNSSLSTKTCSIKQVLWCWKCLAFTFLLFLLIEHWLDIENRTSAANSVPCFTGKELFHDLEGSGKHHRQWKSLTLCWGISLWMAALGWAMDKEAERRGRRVYLIWYWDNPKPKYWYPKEELVLQWAARGPYSAGRLTRWWNSVRACHVSHHQQQTPPPTKELMGNW